MGISTYCSFVSDYLVERRCVIFYKCLKVRRIKGFTNTFDRLPNELSFFRTARILLRVALMQWHSLSIRLFLKATFLFCGRTFLWWLNFSHRFSRFRIYLICLTHSNSAAYASSMDERAIKVFLLVLLTICGNLTTTTQPEAEFIVSVHPLQSTMTYALRYFAEGHSRLYFYT